MAMKRYSSLSELIADYREQFDMTQVDLASKLNVDVRTISRWEKNESLIKTDKEDDFVNALFIPHQVIHNLNSEHPITIFYDLETRTYSMSLIGTQIVNTELFKSAFPVEEEHIHELDIASDYDFIKGIHAMRTNEKTIDLKVIKKSAEKLPDLNLVIFDQAGFYAGHSVFIPLKYETYKKIREDELDESEIALNDLGSGDENDPDVYYFYSLYADSIAHSYYLASRILRFFKVHQLSNYIVAGYAYRENALEMHREMGLRKIREEKQNNEYMATLVEGNYDMYLFGKMN